MVKMIRFFCIIIVLFSCVHSMAQVTVYKQGKATSLVDKHVVANKNNTGKMVGFYVQICSESGSKSRERAENARAMFLSKYPKVSAYVFFKEPNFRVRVGDFRTRAEARGFKEQIQGTFPQSFVVKDEVKFPKHIFETTQ